LPEAGSWRPFFHSGWNVKFLIRPRAWWYNKMPLAVLLLLLLIDGKPFTFSVVAALVGLLGTVCSIANFAYALNELFDLDEDAKIGRTNAAAQNTRRWMWIVIVCSALFALGFAASVAGTAGFWLTALELLLPLAYSVPPLRFKQREWAGIFADAIAAHVYSAVLTLVILWHQGLREPDLRIVIPVLLWAAATGLRGILSHQLQSEENDRRAGLSTVVHRLGAERLVALVVNVILPVEILSFCAVLLECDGTAFLMCIVILFMLYEWLKLRLNAYPVITFTKTGQAYIPFVDEGLYKVWGPLALALDASLIDLRYLALAPLFFLVFRPRIDQEGGQIAMTFECLRQHCRTLVIKNRG
jgi:4-hydroxybenzoate polyprenyltransferase